MGNQIQTDDAETERQRTIREQKFIGRVRERSGER